MNHPYPPLEFNPIIAASTRKAVAFDVMKEPFAGEDAETSEILLREYRNHWAKPAV